MVTPVPAVIAPPLAEDFKNEVICLNHAIRDIVPQELLYVREVIRFALQKKDGDHVESHWTDSGTVHPFEWTYAGNPSGAGGSNYMDKRIIIIHAPQDKVWQGIEAIGGKRGWYHAT